MVGIERNDECMMMMITSITMNNNNNDSTSADKNGKENHLEDKEDVGEDEYKIVILWYGCLERRTKTTASNQFFY